MFLFYLKQQDMSNSTRAIALSALKWVITHGQVFEYEGFPETQIFDGDEYKAVKVEDVLKTKYIPDYIMHQIEEALKQEDNILLKSLIEIGIDTGVRIGEVLELKKGDRKSTRLNSSHVSISYAVFCLKKKTSVK